MRMSDMAPKRRRGKIVSGVCAHCNMPFERPSHGPKHDKYMLCSNRCSALNAARLITKSGRYAKANTVCPECQGTKTVLAQRCIECRRKKNYGLHLSMTIGEARALVSTAAFHAKIRGYARLAYRGPMACAACGYDLHVDIAHLAAIATFAPSATIAEVNDPTNLVALDKRCHWEYDHGYLVYVEGRFMAGTGFEPATSGL